MIRTYVKQFEMHGELVSVIECTVRSGPRNLVYVYPIDYGLLKHDELDPIPTSFLKMNFRFLRLQMFRHDYHNVVD